MLVSASTHTVHRVGCRIQMLVSASALIVHGVEHRSLMLVSALDLDSDVM